MRKREVSPDAAASNLLRRSGEGVAMSKQIIFLALRSRSISTSRAPTNPKDPVTRIVELGVVLYPGFDIVVGFILDMATIGDIRWRNEISNSNEMLLIRGSLIHLQSMKVGRYVLYDGDWGIVQCCSLVIKESLVICTVVPVA